MIERPRHYIALPLSNADRKRAYLLRLIASPHYDEHDFARRVADGLVALGRLHLHWSPERCKERAAARERIRKGEPKRRPILTLTYSKTGT